MKQINKTGFISKFQRGLTLVETAMVLAIGTIVIAGVMIFFQSATTSKRTNETLSQVAELRQIIQHIYRNSPDYTGLSANGLIASNMLPQKMLAGSSTTGLKNAFGGMINVGAGAGNPAQFYITIFNIPADACVKMASMDLGRGVVRITVRDTPITGGGSYGPEDLVFDREADVDNQNPVFIGAACSRGNNVTRMTWMFQ